MTSPRETSDTRRAYHLHARFIVDQASIDELRSNCSSSGVYRYVHPRERLRRHTIRGVAGMVVDCLLPDVVAADRHYALEIGRKADSHESHVRWRLTVRTWVALWTPGHPQDAGHPGPGQLRCEDDDEGIIVLATWYGGGFWAQRWAQHRWIPETGDRRAILLWHYQHWYRWLPAEDVHALADYWACLPHTQEATDIVVLNRTASAALYDLAIQLGWRKLTRREKDRLGLGPQARSWHRAEQIAALRGDASGTGEYTRRAAAADMHYVRTAHGLVDTEG